jgi:hypothetical protein
MPSVTFDEPHPNGAATPPARDHGRVLRQRIAIVALAVIGAAWIFAIIWSVTKTDQSPERMDGATAAQVSAVCNQAQHKLQALPLPFPRLGADRVNRIRRENAILSDMVSRFSGITPQKSAPRTALRGWSQDWNRVIAARAQYATDLETLHRARLIIPATGGIKPITDKMDDFVRENHPNLNACFTQALELDTVEGPREYKKVTA